MPAVRGAACAVVLAALAAALLAAPAAAQDDPRDLCESLYDTFDLVGSRAACERAAELDSTDGEVRWKLARTLMALGNKESDREARRALYEEAVRQARAAVRLAPQDSRAHAYLAATVGKLALFQGGKRKIELSREVRDEAQRAIALDPDDDVAHHVLGRWNREVANLGALTKLAAKVVYGGVPAGASNEQAIAELKRAIEINPRHVNHHLELGITYLDLKRYDEARAEFETALSLPDSDPNDPEYKALAREKLDSLPRLEAQGRKDKSR